MPGKEVLSLAAIKLMCKTRILSGQLFFMEVHKHASQDKNERADASEVRVDVNLSFSGDKRLHDGTDQRPVASKQQSSLNKVSEEFEVVVYTHSTHAFTIRGRNFR